MINDQTIEYGLTVKPKGMGIQVYEESFQYLSPGTKTMLFSAALS